MGFFSRWATFLFKALRVASFLFKGPWMGFFSFKALFFKIYINILLEKSFKTKKTFFTKAQIFREIWQNEIFNGVFRSVF